MAPSPCFAPKAGAASVIGVDVSAITQKAKQIVAENIMSEKVTIICSSVE